MRVELSAVSFDNRSMFITSTPLSLVHVLTTSLCFIIRRKRRKKFIMTHDSYKVLIHRRYYTYYTTIHVHMHNISMLIHIHIHTYTYTYTYIYIYIYIHIHTYTYI